MGSQRFLDALSGSDGTQAPRTRYEVPPVYPDGTVPVAPVRRGTTVPVRLPVPEIDPRVAAAVQDLAAVDRPARAPRTRADRPVTAPPSRAQAARAGYFQGPTPTAIAPAAAARHQAPGRPSYPAAPVGGLPSAATAAAERLRARFGELGGQSGPGTGRTPSPAPSSPQSGPRSSVPASAFQPPAPPQRTLRRKANGTQLAIFLVFFILVVSGLGAQLIDALAGLFER